MIDWDVVIHESLKWIDGFLAWVLPPWWIKVKQALAEAVLMVEQGANADPSSLKGQEKKKKAIDGFENQLISLGLIPEPAEKLLDPLLDSALGWAIDAIVHYLNKTFGKDWVKNFKKAA